MNLKIDTDKFRILPDQPVDLSGIPTQVAPLYERKKEYRKLLESYSEEIREYQSMMTVRYMNPLAIGI